MTTLDQTPRHSTETDRRHLLSETSQAPSLHSQDPHREPITSKPHRGFASEAAYLEAFAEWAESKKYESRSTDLIGFYGETTMREYASRPRQEFGLSKKWKQHKAKKEERRVSAS